MISKKQTYITKDGLKNLKAELENLKLIKRLEIAGRISSAKELGDLSENAEYTEAKRDQEFCEGRIMELESVIRNIVIIEEEVSHKKDVVSIGSKIKIIEVDGVGSKDEREFHIVGSQEADPVNGKISNESPIGMALLGVKVGEVIEIDLPKGVLKCKVIEVE